MEAALAPPVGFSRHFRQSPLTDPWEPLYSSKEGGVVRIGFRAAVPHANSRGFVHGGMISAIADNAMGLSCGQSLEGASLVTVNLAVDFLGSAQLGQWVEVSPKLRSPRIDPMLRRSRDHGGRRTVRKGSRDLPHPMRRS